MADGTTLNKGEGGDVILTDDLGSSKVQVNKIAFGPDGELTLVTSEAPVPATLAAEAADGGAAPSKAIVLAGYDGSAVQRLVTDASGFLQVDTPDATTLLEAVKALLEGTGKVKVSVLEGEPKVKVAELPAIPAGNNNIGDVDVANEPTIKIAASQSVGVAAGSNKIGDVGIGTRTSGGCSMNKNLDVDESEDAVKAEAGQIYGFYFYNAATAVRYLKYYNATVANVTVGTTEPVLTFPLPAGAAGTINFPCPVAFSTAITIAATTGLADNNSGAPGANEVIVDTFFA